MKTDQHFTITLTRDLADVVRTKIASGQYADESEVVAAGLRELFARRNSVETWLRTEVGSAYDRLEADPRRAEPASSVRARLAAAHERAKRGQ